MFVFYRYCCWSVFRVEDVFDFVSEYFVLVVVIFEMENRKKIYIIIILKS